MKINIKATGIELTPSITDYVNKRVATVEKYFMENPDAVAQVEVGRTTHHHKHGDIFRAEIHIAGSGLDLYAVSEQPDLYAAIDLVKDEISRTAQHQKGRTRALGRRGAQAVKNALKGLNIFKKRS